MVDKDEYLELLRKEWKKMTGDLSEQDSIELEQAAEDRVTSSSDTPDKLDVTHLPDGGVFFDKDNDFRPETESEYIQRKYGSDKTPAVTMTGSPIHYGIE